MRRGFYYRLTVLFLVTIGVSFLFAFVAILPSYFLSSMKDNIVNAKLETQKNEPVPLLDQQTLSVVKDLNDKLSLVENAEKSKFAVSEKVINAIILKKVLGIKITGISYKKGDNKINIQGTAPSRETLLLFRESLESSINFKQVDLPISNFVKGSDIQFSLSLSPA